MSELLRLEPLEVVQSELLVPDQYAVVYPGQDAWLQIQRGVTDPGANPAWAMVQKCPDTPGTPAIPGKALSPTVSAPVLSAAQSVFGGTSLYTGGGSGHAMDTPDHADWDFGAGDFTLEGRFYFTVVRKALFAQQNPTDQTDRSFEWTMDVMPSGGPGFTFYYSTDGSNWVQLDNAYTITLNQWYHLALVRSGSSLFTFVNGTQLGATQTITGTIKNSGQPLRLFGDARAAGGANDFQGYVDEVRISKGIARWTSNFTVPTSPYTVDSYTKLLCHFNGLDGATPTQDDTGTPAGPSIPFDPGSNPAWLHIET